LRGFAETRGIDYPLLADVGSVAIRRLGLYNEHRVAQAAAHGIANPASDQEGIPYPGIFVLDEAGIVVSRQFEHSYRPRPSTAAVLETLGLASAERVVVARGGTAEVEIRAAMVAPLYRPYEIERIWIDLAIGPGLHVFGSPIPPDYTPLRIGLSGDDVLVAGECVLPAPTPYAIEGLDDRLVIHEGQVSGHLDFRVEGARGDLTLTLTCAFQACSDTICYPPRRIDLPLSLTLEPLIRD